MYELIVFDLDNTLAKSKTEIDTEMSELFSKLLKKKKVAVITGGGFVQVEKELLFNLSIDSDFENLHIFPNDGASYYVWMSKVGKWVMIYQEVLSEKVKVKIMDAFSLTLSEVKFDKNQSIGELIEDRGSSITFSGLGQGAPLETKVGWDSDNKKRTEIKDLLKKRLPDLEINIAGTTSIDITNRGVNKAYGIKKMIEYIKVTAEEMIYIGDSLFPGGNDNPVISTGVRTISVDNPEETKDIIKKILIGENL